MAYNPSNNTLIMTGHDWYQKSAEISIPTPIRNDNVNLLPRATVIQGFRDPFEGRVAQVNPRDPGSKKTGGHLFYNGSLYVSAYTYYEVAGTAVASHFRRPVDLSSTGQVIGPVKLGNYYPAGVAGYMGHIPLEWQSKLGGTAMTGHAGSPGSHTVSMGPSLEVFNPTQIGQANPVPTTRLLFYPLTSNLAMQFGIAAESANAYWSHPSQVRGVVFPKNTRTVLFFGMHGLGQYCYGEGAACGDPAMSDKGIHAYPYQHQIWAYDADDLVAVKAGTKKHNEVKPYGVWKLDLPYAGGKNMLGGAAYDPATNRIYVSQLCSDSSCAPIVHALNVVISQ